MLESHNIKGLRVWQTANPELPPFGNGWQCLAMVRISGAVFQAWCVDQWEMVNGQWQDVCTLSTHLAMVGNGWQLLGGNGWQGGKLQWKLNFY